MNTIVQIFYLIILTALFSCSGSAGNTNTIVSIKTTLGDIKVILYNETPLHRENFINLINSGFYEGVSFHRIINNFMIQAGDPLTKPGTLINPEDTLNTYTLPAEFNRNLFHKKGALAAARQGNDVNPEMRSSGTQFYIIQGKTLSDDDLVLAEQVINNNIKQACFIKLLSEITDSTKKSYLNLSGAEIQERAVLRLYELLDISGEYKISDEQRKAYTTMGGVPRLDGTYTVFGEVIEGIETVEKIASVQTDAHDRPLENIKILKMKILTR